MLDSKDFSSRFLFQDLQPAQVVNCLHFWSTAPGIALSAGDDVPSLNRFLARNPGLSELVFPRTEPADCVTCAVPRLAATLLAGHDGRRGFLYHVLVSPDFRGQGLGRALVERALVRFAERGIPKVHLMCLEDNTPARAFWESCGFRLRTDLALYSIDT